MKLPPKTMSTVKQSNWQPDSQRGTRQERGYGKEWKRVRGRKLASHPYCEECLSMGKRRLADQVDHIIPFNGLDDPLRLLWDNLRSLCTPCHRRKTSATSRLREKRI